MKPRGLRLEHSDAASTGLLAAFGADNLSDAVGEARMISPDTVVLGYLISAHGVIVHGVVVGADHICWLMKHLPDCTPSEHLVSA